MKELSVLDYIKNKLKFWQKDRPEMPSLAEIFSDDHKEAECLTTETTQALDIDQTDIEIKSVFNFNELPWRALLGLLLALIAQQVMEPPGRSLQMGVVFYLMAGFWLLWAFLRGEFHAEISETILSTGGTHTVRQRDLVIGLALVLASFVFFGKNLFTSFNLLLWGLSLIFLLRAFWLTTKEDIPWWRRTINFLRQRNWQINISRWTLIVAGVVLISIFFRFYRLDGVPSEMFSDHAEKLIDVGNVLGGKHNIFSSATQVEKLSRCT